MELSLEDVKRLFAAGYYSIQCESCNDLIGFVRVDSYDYTMDEGLCGDCAKELVEHMKSVEENVYR